MKASSASAMLLNLKVTSNPSAQPGSAKNKRLHAYVPIDWRSGDGALEGGRVGRLRWPAP